MKMQGMWFTKRGWFRIIIGLPVVIAFAAGCESKQPTGEAKKEAPATEMAKEQPASEAPATEAKESQQTEMETPAGSDDMSMTLAAPDSSPGYKENEEGVTHAKKGHWDIAETHFRKALEADPKLAEAQYNLGLALDKLDKHADATTAFKKAAELAPDNTKITESEILKKHTAS